MNSMDDNLQNTLQSLRAEIEKLGEGEQESKIRLEKLVEDIETKIKSPADIDHHPNLVHDVKDSVAHFEVSHPTVTRFLNDIMMALSNMGI